MEAAQRKSPHLHVKQDVRCWFDLVLVFLFASIHEEVVGT